MKKSLVLLLCLSPGWIIAGTPTNNNSKVAGEVISMCDSTQQEQPVANVEQATLPVLANIPINNDLKPDPANDWKKDGIFRGIFHVGVNFAQIDGDGQAGYDKLGFDGGAGVLVRFHKFLSTSVEINYTQWGAKDGILPGDDHTLYRVKLNYIQVPLALNIHDKELVMFSAGVNVGFRVKYDERDGAGVDITDTVQPQPKLLDVDAFAAVYFFIKKHYGIGAKYSYSIVPFRGVEPIYENFTRIKGEYNNVATIRFVYILTTGKKK